MRTPTAIDAIADDYTRSLAELSPVTATYLGIKGYDHLMGDYSPDASAAYADLNRATLAKLDAAVPADGPTASPSPPCATAWLDLELFDAREYTADLNVIASPSQGFRDILDLMPTETHDDWSTIAQRVAGLPAAMDGFLACLREGIASGLVPARLQADEVAKQADKQTDPATSTFLTLGKDADLPASLRADLDAAGAAAAASYAKLASFLRDELAPAASETDAVGRERYGRFSRLYVGAAVDLDETYEWGLEGWRASSPSRTR